MNIIIKSVVGTLVAVVVLGYGIWFFFGNYLLAQRDQKTKVQISQEVQQQLLETGAKVGVQHILLQMRDGVTQGKDININVQDASGTQFSFTVVAKPYSPSSTKPK